MAEERNIILPAYFSSTTDDLLYLIGNAIGGIMEKIPEKTKNTTSYFTTSFNKVDVYGVQYDTNGIELIITDSDRRSTVSTILPILLENTRNEIFARFLKTVLLSYSNKYEYDVFVDSSTGDNMVISIHTTNPNILSMSIKFKLGAEGDYYLYEFL